MASGDVPWAEPFEVAQQNGLATRGAKAIEGSDQFLAHLEARLDFDNRRLFGRAALFPRSPSSVPAPTIRRQVPCDPGHPAAQLDTVFRRVFRRAFRWALQRPLPDILDQIVCVRPDEVSRKSLQEALLRQQFTGDFGILVRLRMRSNSENTTLAGKDAQFPQKSRSSTGPEGDPQPEPR